MYQLLLAWPDEKGVRSHPLQTAKTQEFCESCLLHSKHLCRPAIHTSLLIVEAARVLFRPETLLGRSTSIGWSWHAPPRDTRARGCAQDDSETRPRRRARAIIPVLKPCAAQHCLLFLSAEGSAPKHFREICTTKFTCFSCS